jgi:hypothetical protein
MLIDDTVVETEKQVFPHRRPSDRSKRTILKFGPVADTYAGIDSESTELSPNVTEKSWIECTCRVPAGIDDNACFRHPGLDSLSDRPVLLPLP